MAERREKKQCYKSKQISDGRSRTSSWMWIWLNFSYPLNCLYFSSKYAENKIIVSENTVTKAMEQLLHHLRMKSTEQHEFFLNNKFWEYNNELTAHQCRGFVWDRPNFLYRSWYGAVLDLCWKLWTIWVCPSYCWTVLKVFPASYTAPKATKLGVHEELGQETAWTADPKQPQKPPNRKAGTPAYWQEAAN